MRNITLIPRGDPMPSRPPIRRTASTGRTPDRRESAAKRGYGAGWRSAREGYLHENPLCVRCLAEGRTTPATVVDHRLPHRGDTELFWDRDNWQSLCKSCHDRKTASEDRRAADTAIIRIVAGPPGSGKSTYVRERSRPDHLVVDVDAIAAALSGCAAHDWPDSILPFACEARDAVLARLLKPSEVHYAWIVTASPDPVVVRLLAGRLGAELVVMETTKDECLRRVAADPDRQPKRDRWPSLIEDWFANWPDGRTE